MSLPRLVRRTSSFVVPVALVALAGAAPAASAKPTLKLALPAQADAGARVAFTYSTKGLPTRGRLVVQRRQGTSGSWRIAKTVKRGRTGSATLPATDWGAYTYRLAVVRGRVVTARSPRRVLRVFKTVSLESLFRVTTGTVNTPARTFPYALSTDEAYGSDGARNVLTIDGAQNTCRAMHIDWTTATDASGAPGGLLSLTVLRQTADPVTSDAPFQTIAGLDAALVPGQSWSLQFHNRDFSNRAAVYMAGQASCAGTIDLP